MKKLKDIQRRIEIARRELERSAIEEDFDELYIKSLYVDLLIEEYLDMKE